MQLAVILLVLVAAEANIRPNRLYEDFYKLNPECNRNRFDIRCWKNTLQRFDYGCRYGSKEECYCCGEIYNYIEHGKICTVYCKKGTSNDENCKKNEFGCCEPIIMLPFNFGEPPESISCNGTEREPPAYEEYYDDEQ